MEDLRELLTFHDNILCADICVNRGEYVGHIILKMGYTEEELQQFLCDIDFTDSGLYYDDIGGTVWLKDGNWIAKTFVPYENDVWEWNYKPEIPEECRGFIGNPNSPVDRWINMYLQ